MNKFSKAVLVAVAFFAFQQNATACDPCALYSVSKLAGHTENVVTLALSEQFTKYKRSNAQDVRSGEFTRDYSTTQLIGAYDFNERFGVQASVPFIYRSFDAVTGFRETDESETGIGDSSFLLSFSPISVREADKASVLSLFAGVKVPTGDSGSLDDALTLSQSPRLNNETHNRHHTVSVGSGTSGRVLTIGTGSTDFLIGSSLSLRRDKVFLLSSLQYAFRTEGDYDYRFDNDLLWNTGPGVYAVLDDAYSVAFRLAVNGEHKGKDRFQGADVEDSQVRNLYVGPEAIFTWRSKMFGELGLDIPVESRKTSTIEPDYRVRFTMGYRF